MQGLDRVDHNKSRPHGIDLHLLIINTKMFGNTANLPTEWTGVEHVHLGPHCFRHDFTSIAAHREFFLHGGKEEVLARARNR